MRRIRYLAHGWFGNAETVRRQVDLKHGPGAFRQVATFVEALCIGEEDRASRTRDHRPPILGKKAATG